MVNDKDIAGWVQECLDDESLFVVNTVVTGNDGIAKVKVILDGDAGVSIDQCASVSRRLAKRLEEVDPFKGKYTIEVTSPGIDMPLTLPRQYVKNIGREIKVVTVGGDTKKGLLHAIEDEKIRLQVEQKSKIDGKKKTIREEIEIPIRDILKTNVLVSFK